MWQDFLQNWNWVSSFLDSKATSPPDLQLYTDASLGYGGFLAGQWFQGHWFPNHTLSKKRGIRIDWLPHILSLHPMGAPLVWQKDLHVV